jgi:hypothetical protein
MDGHGMVDSKILRIDSKNLDAINDFITNPNNPLISDLLEIIDKYGGVNAINEKASEARKLENLMQQLEQKKSSYVDD